jgi:hypothetical protein
MSVWIVGLMLSGIGGAIVHNLDGCLSMVREDGTRPACCALAQIDRVKRDRADCCEDPILASSEPTFVPHAAPNIAPAKMALLPRVAALPTAPAGLAPPHGSAVERPPDRSPRSLSSVFLL